MKKIAAKIRTAWREAGSLLVPNALSALESLLGAQFVFHPVPVRVERVVRYSK